MKAKVIKAFTDKNTFESIASGLVIEISNERFSELTTGPRGIFVEAFEEEPPKEEPPKEEQPKDEQQKEELPKEDTPKEEQPKEAPIKEEPIIKKEDSKKVTTK